MAFKRYCFCYSVGINAINLRRGNIFLCPIPTDKKIALFFAARVSGKQNKALFFNQSRDTHRRDRRRLQGTDSLRQVAFTYKNITPARNAPVHVIKGRHYV